MEYRLSKKENNSNRINKPKKKKKKEIHIDDKCFAEDSSRQMVVL